VGRGPARRLRSLRDAVGWSHDLLPSEEQALFRRLAVFEGGCTLEAAEDVCAEPSFDVLDVLTDLLRKSLVLRVDQSDGSARFTMLETVREYALERLTASGDAAEFQARHAAHYLGLAERSEAAFGMADEAAWLGLLPTRSRPTCGRRWDGRPDKATLSTWPGWRARSSGSGG
jgi:predicted ATPase